MCFAIDMYDCELTSDSRKTFCRQNQKHISGGGGMINERTNHIGCLLASCVTDTDKMTTLHCWTNQSNAGTSTRLVQTCYISCHQ